MRTLGDMWCCQRVFAQTYLQLQLVTADVYQMPCPIPFVDVSKEELQLCCSLHGGLIVNIQAQIFWSGLDHCKQEMFVEANSVQNDIQHRPKKAFKVDVLYCCAPKGVQQLRS